MDVTGHLKSWTARLDLVFQPKWPTWAGTNPKELCMTCSSHLPLVAGPCQFLSQLYWYLVPRIVGILPFLAQQGQQS